MVERLSRFDPVKTKNRSHITVTAVFQETVEVSPCSSRQNCKGTTVGTHSLLTPRRHNRTSTDHVGPGRIGRCRRVGSEVAS